MRQPRGLPHAPLGGRIDLTAERVAGIPVPCLDKPSCFAEKFLANADRGSDDATHARDIVDLAFMLEAWGAPAALEGLARANAAYGDVVARASSAAAARLLDRPDFAKRCIEALRITRQKELLAGLGKLARGAPLRPASRRRSSAAKAGSRS